MTVYILRLMTEKNKQFFFSTFITNKTFNFQIRNEKNIYLNNISARTFFFSTWQYFTCLNLYASGFQPEGRGPTKGRMKVNRWAETFFMFPVFGWTELNERPRGSS